MGAATAQKVEGDISSVFVSLSGGDRPELPKRFLELKKKLVAGREDSITASWQRLLRRLRIENEIIAQRRSSIIPQLKFESLDRDSARLKSEIRKRGATVVKGVVPIGEARQFKEDAEEYIKQNPNTKGFPVHDPQVFELYWSPSQVRARAHPNLIKTQAALMKIWTTNPDCPISLSQPVAYADRLRIRQPGDSAFALGPHQDGGSVERWEDDGYGKSGVYSQVFAGNFEEYDAWDATPRLDAATDLYNAPGNCSAFRMFQGWLSMSWTGPGQGTLLVHPNLQLATAYILLRPFFRVREKLTVTDGEGLWDPQNWTLASADEMTSELQGATPGHGQDVTPEFHPHLQLEKTMVHIPNIEPGDLVVWHCDTIHSVDKSHMGKTDSSVMYIPVCPLTETNSRYLARQREAFRIGTPAPDFPGGQGESGHRNRGSVDDIKAVSGKTGLRTMGLERIEPGEHDAKGALEAIQKANVALGFG